MITSFNCFSIADHIQSERVRKSCLQILNQSWSRSKEQQVMHPIFLGLKSFGLKHQYPDINDCVLCQILQ